MLWFLPGLLIGILLVIGVDTGARLTSTDTFCYSCHIHPQATSSWQKSYHYITESGTRTTCVECHLPPRGEGYLVQKVRTGARDLWGKVTKDPDSFDWEEKGRLENARGHVFESSCKSCHENLFPLKLTKEGEEAHLYYTRKEGEEGMHCINCHLNAGHYIEGYTHGSNKDFGGKTKGDTIIFTSPAVVESFETFTEKIPGSNVSFKMVAVPGGTFMMGSPENEPYRKDDEGPAVSVEISPFFMGECEVSWDEYLAFYAQTSTGGRASHDAMNKRADGIDAITGATPPYGQPDQGWGMDKRPAISISFHAAEAYCRWLSSVTGKRYRLPTEAEWEYAARAGTTTPYFFEAEPKKIAGGGIMSLLRKPDLSVIESYVIFESTSKARTEEPDKVQPNPFGLKNMLGNVAEFCSDWYSPDIYSAYNGSIKDPKGPESGAERVIRGGSYRDKAGDIRAATRDYTRSEQWLRTDPQIPKSIWWYSDCFYVGFRVVCEPGEILR